MQYFLLKCVLYPVGVLPTWALCGVSNFLSWVAYRLVGYRKKVVWSNLRKCFPNKTEKELEQIAWQSYQNLCDLMLNILRIRFASQKRVLRSVHVVNPEIVQQSDDRNMVLLAAHYACWEYIGIMQLHTNCHQTVAAYQPSKGAFERLTVETRARFGAIMAALSDIFRVLLAHQAKGKKTYCLMVSDQSPAAGSCNHWVTFLGQKTPVLVGPERIARKINSTVQYLRITVPKRFHYVYEIVPISNAAADEEPLAITTKFFAELEKDILRYPQWWMWTHKRWKHQNLYLSPTENRRRGNF